MITNYDLLDLGFDPRYKGFKLLLDVVNKKIELGLDKKIKLSELFRLISPDEKPANVETKIRVCFLKSEAKFGKLPVSKLVDELCKRYKTSYDGVRVKFRKVSFNQWKKDMLECGFEFSEEELMDYYKNIRLPQRATIGSAGYDFYAPFDLVVKKDECLKFPTGVKCLMDGDVVLQLFPRSGLGFKYGMQLYNTCGIIDCDYCLAKNEGHIHCKLHYFNDKVDSVVVKQGVGYMQGLFIPFIKTIDDYTKGIRTGGFGSTNGSR